MKAIIRIARKETRTALHSVPTYIIFVIFLIVAGLYFSSTVFKIGKAELRGLFGIMHTLFLFYIPALTMGTIAKEKTGGTLELLSTMPLRLADVIWGKFLSIVFLILMAQL
ncbi:MAG: ABC transporter permease, partial [Candidatus Cloacimonadaceae bacterium]|nr:ABC transporter permease [Candidatus Cloacimonadaceae bacterium]